MGVCTAYISFDNAIVNPIYDGWTQWKTEDRIQENRYDWTVPGYAYNVKSEQSQVDFNNYYFNKSEVDSWATRGFNCSEDPYVYPRCEKNYAGPKFKNTLAVIPLTQHKVNPLKNGRLSYNFLDAFYGDIGSHLQDPLEFSGVYPFSPGDPETIQKPAGWMYSNTNVNEPYSTETNYEGSGSAVDRTTADSTQLDFLPFLNPLNVYDLTENLIGQFDGLAFVVLYGEMAHKFPVTDLPEYIGLMEGLNPAVQTIGLEVNIFLTGTNIPSPRIGRARWFLQNNPKEFMPKNAPEFNYFTTYFKKDSSSIGIPMNFKIRPSQLGEEDPLTQIATLFLSNLKVMVGA